MTPRQPPWPTRLRWFLAEFLVVVCGILGALAVDAWWEGRQEAEREVRFLHQLDADLAASDSVLVEATAFFYDRALAAAAVSRAFWRTAPPPRDSLMRWMAGPLSSGRFRPVTGTAAALVASGSLSLIRNISTRSAVLAWIDEMEARLENIRRFDESYYRDGVDRVTARVRHTDLAEAMGSGLLYERHCDPAGAPADPLELLDRPSEERINQAWCALAPYPTGERRAPFPIDLDEILRDPDVYGGYADLLTAHRNLAIQYAELLRQTRALRRQVQDDLRGR